MNDKILKGDMDDLMDMFSPEPLHKDLVSYVYETDFGTVLKHPLVIMPFFAESMHKMANKSYAAKTEYLKRQLDKGEWSSAISLHERPFRWDALAEYEPKMADDEFWDALGFVWTDSENIWQHFDLARDFMLSDRPGRESLMSEDEQKVLATMPDTLTIYRGWVYEDSEYGLSWSTKFDIASWFACRFAEAQKDKPRVTTATVAKSRVLAYFTGRNESEIVVDPDDVTYVKVEKRAVKKPKRKVFSQDD